MRSKSRKRKVSVIFLGQATPLVLSIIINVAILILIIVAVWLYQPIERYNMGEDKTTQEIGSEYSHALEIYFQSNDSYPWSSQPEGKECLGSGRFPDGKTTLYTLSYGGASCSTYLIGTSMLEDTFENAPEKYLDRITVYYNNFDNKNVVCYLPRSKTYQMQRQTVYKDTLGTLDQEKYCQANGGENACYWCVVPQN